MSASASAIEKQKQKLEQTYQAGYLTEEQYSVAKSQLEMQEKNLQPKKVPTKVYSGQDPFSKDYPRSHFPGIVIPGLQMIPVYSGDQPPRQYMGQGAYTLPPAQVMEEAQIKRDVQSGKITQEEYQSYLIAKSRWQQDYARMQQNQQILNVRKTQNILQQQKQEEFESKLIMPKRKGEPKFTPIEILTQNKEFYNAYVSGKITKTEYQEAMLYQNQLLASSRSYYKKHPQVTIGELRTLQRDYPELYKQTKGKIITDVEITKAGATVELMEKEHYRALVQPNPKLPENAPERITALETALQKYRQEPKIKLYPSGKGGTSPPSQKDPSALLAKRWEKYTPEERQALEAYLAQERAMKLVDLGLFVTTPLAFTAAPAVAAKSAIIGVGLSQAFQNVGQVFSGQPLTFISPEQALRSGASGAIFGVATVGIMTEAGRFIPTSIMKPELAYATGGIKGVASGMASRAVTSAGLGAVGGFVLSGGKTEEAIKGAGYGAAFSVGFDVLGIALSKTGVPKYGKVEIPLESGEKATWQGLYWSRGENAKLLIGKTSFPSEGRILTRGPSGEGVGWAPESNVDVAVTKKLLNELGYSAETVQDVEDILFIMSKTQHVKSKYIEELLPSKTSTLSEKGVSTIKEYVVSHKAEVEELYGSFASKSQVSKEFEYSLGGKSALREPGDIDIQLKTAEQELAVKFTEDILSKLKVAGEQVRISPEYPTIIEAWVGDKWAHAVDIHFAGEPITDVLTPTTTERWGFDLSQPSTKMENIPVMRLSEQGVRKGTSILGFTREGDLMMPQAHRIKDIPDFFQSQRTLIESKYGVGTEGLPMSKLTRLSERYGLKLDDVKTVGETYLVSPTIPDVAVPTTVIVPSVSIISQTVKQIPSAKVSLPQTKEIIGSSPSTLTSKARQSISQTLISSKTSKSQSPIEEKISAKVPSYTRKRTKTKISVPSLQPSKVGSPKIVPSPLIKPSPSIAPSPSLSPVPSPSPSPSPSESPSLYLIPSIAMSTSKKPPLQLRVFEKKKKKKKKLEGGLWRKRVHPIPSPEEITSNLMGRKRKGK